MHTTKRDDCNCRVLIEFSLFKCLKVKCRTSGHCVTEQRVCDLVNDCNDGTDEAPALCSNRKASCDFSVNWCGWFNYWADDFNWLRGNAIGTPGTGMGYRYCH